MNCLFGINLHPCAQNAFIHIICPLLNDSASLHAFDELFGIFHLEDEDVHEFDVLVEQLGLFGRPGDAVEEKKLLVGEIPVGGDEPFHVVVPDADGDLIRQKVAFMGIGVEKAAGRGFRGEASKDIPGGEVEVVSSAAEELSEGAFARTGGAKYQNRAVGTTFAGYK